MVVTLQYARQQFDYFNTLIFNGELPSIPIVIVKARSFLGKLCYERTRRGRLFVYSPRNFTMRLSSSFDLTEAELQDVIIHEMIHYYIAYKGIKDTSAHGVRFRSLMAEINSTYGRMVSVKCKKAPNEMEHSGPTIQHHIKQHYVCISSFKDGTKGLTVCSAAMFPRVSRGLRRYYPDIKECSWYVTVNPYFERFPHSRLPRIYHVRDISTLIPMLNEALNGRD